MNTVISATVTDFTNIWMYGAGLPDTIGRLYCDFSGFFASVEKQADKSLRGRAIQCYRF